MSCYFANEFNGYFMKVGLSFYKWGSFLIVDILYFIINEINNSLIHLQHYLLEFTPSLPPPPHSYTSSS